VDAPLLALGGVILTRMLVVKTAALFLLTACAEITGCFLFWLVVRQHRSAWLLGPAAVGLGIFAWLLTFHPSAAGRTYAAYGGVYVATAVLWLWLVEKQRPDRWDLVGAAVSLVGMAIIAFGPRQ
jgi:small multidrug resistance family-3 protein